MPTDPTPTDELMQLVYVSRATRKQAPDVLEGILEVSRRRNAENGVTGVLYYFDHRYLQYLEGPPAAVDATMERIRRDPRHTDIEVLIEGDTETRLFAEWHMANRPLDAATWQRLAQAEWPTIIHLDARHPEGLGVIQAVLAQSSDQGLYRRPRGPAATARPGRKQRMMAIGLAILVLVALAWPFVFKDHNPETARTGPGALSAPSSTPMPVPAPLSVPLSGSRS